MSTCMVSPVCVFSSTTNFMCVPGSLSITNFWNFSHAVNCFCTNIENCFVWCTSQETAHHHHHHFEHRASSYSHSVKLYTLLFIESWEFILLHFLLPKDYLNFIWPIFLSSCKPAPTISGSLETCKIIENIFVVCEERKPTKIYINCS